MKYLLVVFFLNSEGWTLEMYPDNLFASRENCETMGRGVDSFTDKLKIIHTCVMVKA